jgi:hypothetical protein
VTSAHALQLAGRARHGFRLMMHMVPRKDRRMCVRRENQKRKGRETRIAFAASPCNGDQKWKGGVSVIPPISANLKKETSMPGDGS